MTGYPVAHMRKIALSQINLMVSEPPQQHEAPPLELNKKPYALPTVCQLKRRIDPTPDYQRPPAWSRKQKQLLMDTILRGYDIPKCYWRRVNREDGVQWEVIDGQQRLRAIWEFKDNQYPLAKDADPIDGHDVAGLKFDDLPIDVMDAFETYSLDVVIVTDAVDSDEEVRDMFLRLQNGTNLKAQEKRNAMTGGMRDFIKLVAAHPFFKVCKFTNTRFTFDHVAAQTTLLELEGGPTNVKDGDLNRMYSNFDRFEADGAVARKVIKTYDYLLRAFPAKTPELERYNVINLYCIASSLLSGYVHEGTETILAEWFINFESERRANDSLPEEERDYSLVEYRRLTSQSTDAEESIRARVDAMEKRFFLYAPDIETIDPIRDFSPEQRLAIFRRDDGRCQLKIKCDGIKVEWGHWHADHKIPHSKGGKTTVSNGVVACPACNLAKGAG